MGPRASIVPIKQNRYKAMDDVILDPRKSSRVQVDGLQAMLGYSN